MFFLNSLSNLEGEESQLIGGLQFMSSKYYLTIKRFPVTGGSFKTDVESYDFGHPKRSH